MQTQPELPLRPLPPGSPKLNRNKRKAPIRSARKGASKVYATKSKKNDRTRNENLPIDRA